MKKFTRWIGALVFGLTFGIAATTATARPIMGEVCTCSSDICFTYCYSGPEFWMIACMGAFGDCYSG